MMQHSQVAAESALAADFYTSSRDHWQFKKRFDIKTSPVDVYPGNRICVDSDRYNVLMNQKAYIDELLGK